MVKMTYFYNHLRKFDLYGIYMSLNYKGADAHNTWLGILFSLAHILVITFYGTSCILRLHNREDPDVSMNELYYNLDNQLLFPASDLKFDFAFTMKKWKFNGKTWRQENMG